MNILHIGKFYPPYHGGMENYLCDLAEAQTAQGHEVTVWVHNHEWQGLTSHTNASQVGKVKLIRQKSLKPLFFAPVMLGFKQQLKRIITDEKPDLIHLHWPNPSLFKLLLNKPARKIPWVVSWHSDMVTSHSSFMLKLIYLLVKPLETMLVKHSDSLLVSTQAYADYSKQLCQHVEKTHVIPLGISTKPIEELKIGADTPVYKKVVKNWQDKQFKLFHLGRLTFYKNQRFLIKTLAELPETQLLIAGKGQLHDKLKQQISELSLISRVKLLGDIDKESVHALYASCDLFCMASHDRAESFGVVLLEAMYHNKIILVPDTAGSGMHWLAENYAKGFVYKSNDCDDFVAKVKFIRQNFKDIMSEPSVFKFEMKHIAESVTHLYKKILTGEKK